MPKSQHHSAAKDLQNMAIRAPSAMGILMFLAEHTGETNTLIASQRAIAQSINISLKTVTNAVNFLREHNYIEVTRVGNVTAYTLGERVKWTGKAGERQATFRANVLALEVEQGGPIAGPKQPLKAVPRVG